MGIYVFAVTVDGFKIPKASAKPDLFIFLLSKPFNVYSSPQCSTLMEKKCTSEGLFP